MPTKIQDAIKTEFVKNSHERRKSLPKGEATDVLLKLKPRYRLTLIAIHHIFDRFWDKIAKYSKKILLVSTLI